MPLMKSSAANAAVDSISAAAQTKIRMFPSNSACLDFEGLADLRNDDLGGCVLHAFDELVGRLVDNAKGRVMARNDGFELEEAAAGKRCHGAAHGETVADRHDADRRLVQFVDQRHV